MIEAHSAISFGELAARIVRRAAQAAEAHAKQARLSARGDGSHWRRADLVWPHFTKG